VSRGIPTARNAAKDAAVSQIVKGKDGITEKSLNVAVYPNAFVFEKQRFWPRKQRNFLLVIGHFT